MRLSSRQRRSIEASESALQSRSDESRRIYEELLHRLKQPLTALRGTLEVALLPGQSPGDLDQAVHAALGLVESLTGDFDLLQEAIESDDPGDQTANMQWIELIQRAATEVSELQTTRRVRVSIRWEKNCRVRANRERLFKATEDCLRLAIERSPAGSVVRASLVRRDKGMLLTVRYAVRPQSLPGPPPKRTEALWPDEIREWLLKRTIKAQGGSLWTKSHSPGERSLHIRLPSQIAPT
jgi:signal transduction histidine kinase